MCTITHAYLAVAIAGLAAFVLLLVCGQHHSLASVELGGTEVSMSSSELPGAKSARHQVIAPAPKATTASGERTATGPSHSQ